jgi:hypothetical protein
MNNLPTAEEFLNSNSLKGHVAMDSVNEDDIVTDMIEFAKLHVEAALKAAAEKARVCNVDDHDPLTGQEFISSEVVKDSILNAYPLNLIK